MQGHTSLPNPILAHVDGLDISATEKHLSTFFDPPTGTLPERALQTIEALLPKWAVHHCLRVWAFGLVIAEAAQWSVGPKATSLGWDRTLWFLVAILHDIGWDEEGSLNSRLSFELYGGIKAREWLLEWGASQDIADEVCEAIVRHTVSLPFHFFTCEHTSTQTEHIGHKKSQGEPTTHVCAGCGKWFGNCANLPGLCAMAKIPPI